MTTITRKTGIAIASLAATGALIAGCSSDATDSAKDAAGNMSQNANDAAGSATNGGEGAEGGENGGAEGGDVANTEIQGANGSIEVKQPIADKYQELGGPNGHLGDPVGEQQEGPNGGYFVDFEGASIYWTPETDAHFVQGKIKDAWMADGGVEKLGYPTTDEEPIADGLQSDFQNGHITYIDDQTEVVTN